ncbi:hypothetical protein PFUGPA_03183 [Plasmodium falciparum Palo Alto/Uganda]|nr:hypothetical protein PFUGPA_03183 [Plasmodium falciparum Palo Alto/Uganda]
MLKIKYHIHYLDIIFSNIHCIFTGQNCLIFPGSKNYFIKINYMNYFLIENRKTLIHSHKYREYQEFIINNKNFLNISIILIQHCLKDL